MNRIVLLVRSLAAAVAIATIIPSSADAQTAQTAQTALSPAAQYVHGSVSLTGLVEASVAQQSFSTSSEDEFAATGSGQLRFVYRGFAVIPSFGLKVIGSILQGEPGMSGTNVEWFEGLSVGYAFALASNLALTPNVGIALSERVVSGWFSGPAASYSLDAHVPFTIFLGRHTYLDIGAEVVWSPPQGSALFSSLTIAALTGFGAMF